MILRALVGGLTRAARAWQGYRLNGRTEHQLMRILAGGGSVANMISANTVFICADALPGAARPHAPMARPHGARSVTHTHPLAVAS